jgi:hypothetical protein
MIVEFVQFTYPLGLTREQILEDARRPFRDGEPTRNWSASTICWRRRHRGAFYICRRKKQRSAATTRMVRENQCALLNGTSSTGPFGYVS